MAQSKGVDNVAYPFRPVRKKSAKIVSKTDQDTILPAKHLDIPFKLSSLSIKNMSDISSQDSNLEHPRCPTNNRFK